MTADGRRRTAETLLPSAGCGRRSSMQRTRLPNEGRARRPTSEQPFVRLRHPLPHRPPCVGRLDEFAAPPPHRGAGRVGLPQRRRESWGHGIRLYAPSCWNETLHGYWLGFSAIAIIDFASGGMRPTRRKEMFSNPASRSNRPSVSLDQNLMCPCVQSAVKWSSIFPVTASARFFQYPW